MKNINHSNVIEHLASVKESLSDEEYQAYELKVFQDLSEEIEGDLLSLEDSLKSLGGMLEQYSEEELSETIQKNPSIGSGLNDLANNLDGICSAIEDLKNRKE